MIHPICVKDQIAYKPHKNGVYVFELASILPAPSIYKIWHADTKICPICRHVIVVGFSAGPLAEHFQEGFAEKVAQIEAHEAVIRCYEYPEEVTDEQDN